MTSPRSGKTGANAVLTELLSYEDGDLRNILGIAVEYSDHPSFHGVGAIPAGKRLLAQLRLALDEYKTRMGRKEAGS